MAYDMINVKIDMTDFIRLPEFNGKKSFYNHNFYQSRYSDTIIYVEASDDSGYYDVYIVNVEKGGEKEFLVSGPEDEKGIIRGEYKRSFN